MDVLADVGMIKLGAGAGCLSPQVLAPVLRNLVPCADARIIVGKRLIGFFLRPS